MYRLIWPFTGFWNGVEAAGDGIGQLSQGTHAVLAQARVLGLVALLLGAVATVGALRRLPIAYGVYPLMALALAPTTQPRPQPPRRLTRYLVFVFPLFSWLATACEPTGPDGAGSASRRPLRAQAGRNGRAPQVLLRPLRRAARQRHEPLRRGPAGAQRLRRGDPRVARARVRSQPHPARQGAHPPCPLAAARSGQQGGHVHRRVDRLALGGGGRGDGSRLASP